MAFDNLNYSTEKQVDEESIQDKIDQKILDITKLTKSNLGNLKVDILNSKSSLNVRDIDGNIIGKVKEGESLNFNGENKTIKHKGKDKIFLGIDMNGGKKGFISADYVKGEVSTYTGPVEKPGKGDTVKPNVIKKPNNSDELDTGEENENNIDVNEASTEELLQGLNNRRSKFEKIARKTEELENVLGIAWDEEEKIDLYKKELDLEYKDIMVIIEELIKVEKKIPEVKNKLSETYLFLAKYYSGGSESLDNDHLRNYNISNIMALGILKDIKGCPDFPIIDENYEREIKIFDIKLEDFLNNIKDTKDTKIAMAVSILQDNRGIGWFDFEEETTDGIIDNAGGMVSVIAGTAAVIIGSPGLLVGGTIVGGAALIGTSVNTISRGESDGAGQFLGEAGVLAFQGGAAGTIAKFSTLAVAKSTSIWATTGIIGAEMVGDVALVGMIGDGMRSYVFDYDYNVGESFQENLIWAPLALLGGGGKSIMKSLERAKIKKAIGDTKGAIEEIKIFNKEVSKLKTELAGKEFDVNLDGVDYKVGINKEGQILTNVNSKLKSLDPSNKDDAKIIKKIAVEIHNRKALFGKKIENTNANTKNENALKIDKGEFSLKKTNKTESIDIKETKYLSDINKEIRILEQARNVARNKKQKGKIKEINEKLKFWKREKKIEEVNSTNNSSKIELTTKKVKNISEKKNISKEINNEIEYYKNSKTGIEYTKNTDGIYSNNKTGKILKNKPRGIEKIDKPTKKEKPTVKEESVENKSKKSDEKKETSTSNKGETKSDTKEKTVDTKEVNKLFEKQFLKEINLTNKIEINKLMYEKRSDGLYKINGDNSLYSQKDLLSKIKIENKIDFLKKLSETKVSLLGKKEIKIKDTIFTYKEKYKISKDEITINENGKIRILNEKETIQFYENNYKNILNNKLATSQKASTFYKNIEKATGIGTTLNQGGKYIGNTLKSFLDIGYKQLGFSAAFIAYDISTNNADSWSEFTRNILVSIATSLVIGKVFKMAGVTYKVLKDGSIGTASGIIKTIGQHWKKIAVGGTFIWVLNEGNEQINKNKTH